jgi:hypothetical protein
MRRLLASTPSGFFRVHVNVGFFHGASLDDRACLLEGSGKRMRHVKLRWGSRSTTPR